MLDLIVRNVQNLFYFFSCSPRVQCFTDASSYTIFLTAFLGGGVGYGGAAVPSVGRLSLPLSFGHCRGQGLLAGWHGLGCRAQLDHSLGWHSCREYFLLQLND